MQKLPKEKIIEIAKRIFADSDIVAQHGTSISNAMSILETGFYFNKTSMAALNSKNIVTLCSYGWKENERGNSSNVIISVPRSFIKMLTDRNDEQYNEWIKNANFDISEMIKYFSDQEIENPENETGYNEKIYIILPPIIKYHTPREFIKGFFAFCDDKIYLDFLSNPEEALEHLTYIDNPYFFDNLSSEQQEHFVNKFKQAVLNNGSGKK